MTWMWLSSLLTRVAAPGHRRAAPPRPAIPWSPPSARGHASPVYEGRPSKIRTQSSWEIPPSTEQSRCNTKEASRNKLIIVQHAILQVASNQSYMLGCVTSNQNYMPRHVTSNQIYMPCHVTSNQNYMPCHVTPNQNDMPQKASSNHSYMPQHEMWRNSTTQCNREGHALQHSSARVTTMDTILKL